MFRTAVLLVSSSIMLCVGPAFSNIPESSEPVAELGCVEAFEDDEFVLALAACRDELEANPGSLQLKRLVAATEYEAGEPDRALTLWREIIAIEGWRKDTSRGLAMALWRTGRIDEVEPILVEIKQKNPDQQAYRDLIRYYNSFERHKAAAKVGVEGSAKFPNSCEIYEDRGVTQAALGNDAAAARLLEQAIAKGCPTFRWTSRGVLRQRLDKTSYADLLNPKRIVNGLAELDDGACRERLTLLKHTMSVEAGPAVANVVMNRRTSEVRLAGLGLLTQLGAAGAPFWEKVLRTDDFILQKHAIRRIRELQEPVLQPLLESCLERDQTPGNRALTRLTLGEYLLRGGETRRGEELILAIPEDHNLYGVGLLSLATFHEKTDPKRALDLIKSALEKSPALYVDQNRIEMLEGVVAQSESN